MLKSFILKRKKLFNAFYMGKRSFTSQEALIFNCPRKEFAKYINMYHLAQDTDSYGSIFVFKDRIWTLYSEIKDDYEFTEYDLRTILKVLPISKIEEDLKLKRVQEIIDKMINLGHNPGGDGLIALINAYESSPNAMDKIEGLLYSWKHSPPQTKRVYNMLLRVYAKIHGTEVAEKWFDSLIGTMIYGESKKSGKKAHALRPLLKDGGIYTHLIKMYCEEGNLVMATKKFNEMFNKFDQSNRNGAIGRIMLALIRDGRHFEAIAWYTTSQMYYMYMDETGYSKVFRAIILYAFSKNVFITAKDIINMLGELGPEWKVDENEISSMKTDNADIAALISDLNVDTVLENQSPSSSLYYSQDNCLETEPTIENAVDFKKSDKMEANVPKLLQEMTDLFKNQKFGDTYVINYDMLPVDYDKGFFKSDPRKMFKSILSDMFTKTRPSLLTFNAIIYSYFKVGAYEECVKVFEYMQKRLDISYDFSITISIMSKVYYKLGEMGKAASLARLDNSEMMEGDHISMGAQFGVMLSAGRYEELEGIFKELDENRDIGSQNMTYVLRMYIKENKMDEARRLFDRIIETQLQEGKMYSVPFNIMMYKYAHMGDIFSFNALITQMLDLGMKLDEDTYVHIIRAYIRWNDLETAFEYYRKMLSQGISQTLHSYHIVIDLFAKMNNENGMMGVIRTMITKGVMPNEHTLVLLVGYYVNLGKVEEAHKVQDLFQKSFPHISGYMRCHNIIINHYTNLENRAGVLNELHRATAVFGAIPDISTYTCMVKLFALSDIKAARKIFELALEKCRHGLDVEIFATMIEASYDAGDYDSAIEIYNRMNALDIVPDQKIIKLSSRLKATSAVGVGAPAAEGVRRQASL